jgi:D-alanyl-D-alanine carboxypeptidase (penicillin-binding protein 5/6)
MKEIFVNKIYKRGLVCMSKYKRLMRKLMALVTVTALILVTGCGSNNFKSSKQLNIGVLPELPVYGSYGIADNYAVIEKDEELEASAYGSYYAALLVDDTTKTPLVAHNVHDKIYPASMTKLMTGLLVMESIESGDISLDDIVTLNRRVTFDDYNAMASDLVGGCKITVKNLLYGLMITSYNDCGVILAELVAGSESAFCDMMNAKAKQIGATNTHFANCHGLHSDDHYTTAYDLYLIINEFSKHDLAYMIDSLTSYDFTYTDANGTEQIVTIEPTNCFLTGDVNLPEGYSVGSWKTGTTDQALNCLIMEFTNDSTGDKYVALIAGADGKEALYSAMTNLINTAK